MSENTECAGSLHTSSSASSSRLASAACLPWQTGTTTKTDERRFYLRQGRPVRAFTAREDMSIEGLRIAGWSLREISRFVNRGKSTVQDRLHLLARRAEEDS